jgi:ribonuclease J
MRTAHKELGKQSSIPESNILILDNGVVTELRKTGELVKTKEKVPAGYVMVEGPDRSEVASHILMDRQLMAENGAVVVLFQVQAKTFRLRGKPSVESRGFVFFDLKNKVTDEIKKTGERAFAQFFKANPRKINKDALVVYLAQTIDRALVRMLDKKPLVLPILVEI